MNKGDLVSTIRDKTEFGWKEAHLAVDTFLDVVREALVNGDHVTLTGFGKFTPRVRAASKGRNLKTGESMDVSAKNVVSFKAGRSLKDALNP